MPDLWCGSFLGGCSKRNIDKILVYVKLKIRNQQKQVVCVSFHYAKDKMEFPYETNVLRRVCKLCRTI